MHRNRTWSALIIAIFFTSLMVVVALYLLERIVPFSRDIKGVENGNVSYYRANTALNEALLSMSGLNPGYETGSSSVMNGSGIVYKVTAMSRLLPLSGQGESEYDRNWSVIAPWKPIQLALHGNINWNSPDTYFNFRIPDLDKDNGTIQSLSGWSTKPIINWILSASGISLVASGSQIMADGTNGTDVAFDGRSGLTTSWSSMSFGTFYGNNCAVTACILKLSLISPLLLSDNTTIAPYLEYQAHFNVSVPLQSAIVETQGYMGGFRKDITRYVQQTTTNEALDFTVFQ